MSCGLLMILVLLSGCERMRAEESSLMNKQVEPAMIEQLDDEQDDITPSHPNILSSNKVTRSSVELKPYLSVGQSVTIHSSDEVIGRVTLDKVEIIENEKGYEDKSIVLHFTETNLSAQPLNIGENQVDLLNVNHLFYETLYLDAFTESDIKYFNKLPSYDGKVMCQTPDILEHQASRQCYQVYSYAGSGSYLLSLATNITSADRWYLDEWKSYYLTISEEQE